MIKLDYIKGPTGNNISHLILQLEKEGDYHNTINLNISGKIYTFFQTGELIDCPTEEIEKHFAKLPKIDKGDLKECICR